MVKNSSWESYSRKASLLKNDPYFLNKKEQENYDETSIQRKNITSLLKTTVLEKDGENESSSSSELSFVKPSNEPIQVSKNLQILSSAKKIKEQFSANDSFYDQMLTELNSNKKHLDFDENNVVSKKQDVEEYEYNENASFLDNPKEKAQKGLSESGAKVKRFFDTYDTLKDWKKKLEEKEKEIGSSFANKTKKKSDLFLPLKLSPSKKNNNDLLVKSATEKVQKMFQSIKTAKNSNNIEEISKKSSFYTEKSEKNSFSQVKQKDGFLGKYLVKKSQLESNFIKSLEKIPEKSLYKKPSIY